jgi:hypothetical protein
VVWVAWVVGGFLLGLLVLRLVGVGFLRLAWFVLDRAWGMSLVLAGAGQKLVRIVP